jgi:predicted amidohydrolase YtcJ
VTPLNPLMSLWVSAVRRTREGMYLGPQETVSVLRALRGYTIDAAYQGFEERVKGTLEVGKYADFVVLSDNIFNVPLRNLCDIDVKMTVQAGHITHSDFSIAAPPELTFWARMAQRTLPQQP